MDKLLSCLFCCSVSTKDDGDDMVNSQQGTKSRNANSRDRVKKVRQDQQVNGGGGQEIRKRGGAEDREGAGNVAAAVASDKKDILDDENSVNETDTITNTNEESNNAPIAQHDPTHTAANSQEKLVPSGNGNGAVTAADGTGDGVGGNGNVANGNDVENGDVEDQEMMYEEDGQESFLDLTKLQEGQAYNKQSGRLLGFKDKKFGNKKCLVLDLDETLVHSSFKYLRSADFVIPVEIDNQVHHVYVIKRPGVDEFLEKVGRWFEVVVFTASVLKYGDPLLDKLDINKSVHHRLFRDSCYNYQGNFIKNLSQLGRPLSDSIIIDNSPASYIFHPQHSVPISSWFSDTHDNELLDLLPFLEDISKSNVDDVGLVLDISL